MNSRLWLVLLLTALAAGGVGYVRGVGVTQSRLQATLAHETAGRAQDRATRALEDRARAEAVAEAERAARERVQEETARNAVLAAELATARQHIADERQSFNRRLSYVAENAAAVCTGLPFEWVGLYNEATRSIPAATGSRARASRASAPAAAAADLAPTAGTARAGIRGGTPLTRQREKAAQERVTPKDILAHVRDYGGYCRSLEAQLQSLLPIASPAALP